MAFLSEVGLAVVGSLDREANPALVFVDLDHAGFDFSTFIEDVLDLFNALFAHLRDVHEAVDVVVEFDERTIAGDLGYLALDHVADLEVRFDLIPWIRGELLHAERNTLAVGIHVEHDGVDFVALLHHFGRVIDLAGPRHVRHVDHTVDTFFEFNESTIGGEVAHLTTDAGANWVVVASHFPRIGFQLASAERDLLLFLLDTENDSFDFVADAKHFTGLGDTLRPRKLSHVNETLNTFLYFDERTVRHEINDLTLNRRADWEAFFDLFPRVVSKLLEAERDAFALAVDLNDHHFDLFTLLHHFRWMLDATP